MNEEHFRELSAARALHALSPEDEQAFSRALAAHPEWRSTVDEDQEAAAALGAMTPPVPPPPDARDALLAAIAGAPQAPAPSGGAADASDAAPSAATSGAAPSAAADADAPAAARTGGERGSRPPRRRAAWFALAASVAVLIAVSLAIPWGRLLAPSDPVSLALQEIDEAPDARSATAPLPGGGSATLRWSAETAQAVFVAEGMETAPEGRDYEAWVVRGETPVSLGVMDVDDAGRSEILATGFAPGDAVAVTVETRGGSPSGAPSGDPIVAIPAA
ncbi:anti-sigma factor [Leucobacter allii]|uniref:Regulator of SigK n=1 Tax=Leucobacter allii TaxID=2932247 RepID=A0ABY4FH92_9MICO|nr:anti-sigma factor [Leucobacter allii]UOQ56035.1 anti-sigma factor [Leucobacter allii]